MAALAERGTLPPQIAIQLQALVVPVANGVRSFVDHRVLQVMQSDVFAETWVQANRSAHQLLISVLTGETSGGVIFEDNAVKVNLAAFLVVVKERLVANCFQLAARDFPMLTRRLWCSSLLTSESPSDCSPSCLDGLGMWLPLILMAMPRSGSTWPRIIGGPSSALVSVSPWPCPLQQ